MVWGTTSKISPIFLYDNPELLKNLMSSASSFSNLLTHFLVLLFFSASDILFFVSSECLNPVCAIKKYNSNANGGHGYNRTGGGGGITGYRFTSEDKIKIAKAAKESAYNIWGYNRRAQLCLFPTHTGFKHSDETKNKISEALKNNKTRKWVSKLEKEDAEDIKFLRSSGLSYKKIGEIFDVVPQTIFYFCKRNMI